MGKHILIVTNLMNLMDSAYVLKHLNMTQKFVFKS
jgi:hypothetical protein